MRARTSAARFRSTGSPLDRRTRRLLEPLLGHDLGSVRVHRDESAARQLGAAAFAAGPHVAFAPGRYEPDTPRGLRLLAHELAHVVQQERRGGTGDPERGARTAAARAVEGGSVSPAELGSAPPGLYAQDDEERTPTTVQPAFTLPWDALLRPGAFQLTPPGLLPGTLTPPGATGTDPGTTPSAPSRLPVATSGSFSLGLRLGFPQSEARAIPGAPPSALSLSLRRAELMNEMLTGHVPRGWDAIDKGQLASAVWGIFSTHIAPDLARSITSGLSGSTGAGGPSYQLDLVLLTNFSGGGLSFSVEY